MSQFDGQVFCSSGWGWLIQDCVGDLRFNWAAGEAFAVGDVGRVEGGLAGVVDWRRRCRSGRMPGVPSDAGVAKDVVLLGEESLTERSGVLDGGEGSGEVNRPGEGNGVGWGHVRHGLPRTDPPQT